MNRKRLVIGLAIVFGLVGCGAAASSCSYTTHAVEPSKLGVASRSSSLEEVVMTPGPVTVETVVAADWEVPLSGLVNLDDPKAKAAGLTDRPEPIQIYLHALHHPTRGLFIVDTGVEHALKSDPEHAAIRGVVTSFMHMDKMVMHTDTKAWLAQQNEPVSGVLLTHLHLDHVSGIRDLPTETPVYSGPGEAHERGAVNVLLQPIMDRELEGHPPVREWQFTPDPDGAFAGILDVFGDQSVFALSVPGHTPGSAAYLVRTPRGPVLLTGDACHTSWGWENGVEPGSFSSDRPKSADSLARLIRFAAKHPGIDVRLGHQGFVQK